MTPLRATVMTFATVIFAGGLVAASGVAIPWHATGDAVLRLSWSARPERIEHCRALSPSDIASRPEHMRRAVECTGALATYDMTVVIDDSIYDASVIHGSGMRQDRPMFLMRDYRVAQGDHRVQVQLTRREQPDSLQESMQVRQELRHASEPADLQSREVEQRREVALYAIPARMTLDTVARFSGNAVTLVTYTDRTLVIRIP